MEKQSALMKEAEQQLGPELYTEAMDVMGPQLAAGALPELHSLMDQLAELIEQAYDRQSLTSTIQQHPGLGSTAQQLVQNWQARRQEYVQQQHLNVEDVLTDIRWHVIMPYIHYVHRYDSFLQAAVLGADALVEVLLAKPRLLQLAAAVLNCCLDSLPFRPGAQLKWSAPPTDKQGQTTAVVSSLLQRCPHIADSIPTFAGTGRCCQQGGSYVQAATVALHKSTAARALCLVPATWPV